MSLNPADLKHIELRVISYRPTILSKLAEDTECGLPRDCPDMEELRRKKRETIEAKRQSILAKLDNDSAAELFKRKPSHPASPPSAASKKTGISESPSSRKRSERAELQMMDGETDAKRSRTVKEAPSSPNKHEMKQNIDGKRSFLSRLGSQVRPSDPEQEIDQLRPVDKSHRMTAWERALAKKSYPTAPVPGSPPSDNTKFSVLTRLAATKQSPDRPRLKSVPADCSSVPLKASVPSPLKDGQEEDETENSLKALRAEAMRALPDLKTCLRPTRNPEPATRQLPTSGYNPAPTDHKDSALSLYHGVTPPKDIKSTRNCQAAPPRVAPPIKKSGCILETQPNKLKETMIEVHNQTTSAILRQDVERVASSALSPVKEELVSTAEPVKTEPVSITASNDNDDTSATDQRVIQRDSAAPSSVMASPGSQRQRPTVQLKQISSIQSYLLLAANQKCTTGGDKSRSGPTRLRDVKKDDKSEKARLRSKAGVLSELANTNKV